MLSGRPGLIEHDLLFKSLSPQTVESYHCELKRHLQEAFADAATIAGCLRAAASVGAVESSYTQRVISSDSIHSVTDVVLGDLEVQ